MAISFNGEQNVLTNNNFTRGDFNAAVRDNRYNHSYMRDRSSPGAQSYDAAIRRLQRIQGGLPAGQLSPQSRTQIRQAVQDVKDARLAAARNTIQNPGENGILRDPGTGEIVRRDPGAQTLVERAGAGTRPGGQGTPQGRTIQNPGEEGIHRDPGTGEIVRRDQGAQTLLERSGNGAPPVTNSNEPGIRRDPGTGEIIGRDPGARTALEQADQNDRYARSGNRVYRQGPTEDQVNGGGRVLREGDKGPAVRRLQESLRAAGYNVGQKGADGFYGPDTQRAVAEFLRHQNNPRTNVGHEELNRLLRLRLENI